MNGHGSNASASGNPAVSGNHVIFPMEAEAFVQELTTFSISDIGSNKWSVQREHLEQLNMQAVCNVSLQTDEFVKEYLISYEKLPILVHELLAVEIWREKVFPLMVEKAVKPRTSFPAYLVLYHEGTVASLLETSLYYRECCENGEDCILDLLDYCQRSLTRLLVKSEGGQRQGKMVDSEESSNEEDSEEEDEDGDNVPSKKKILTELKEQEQTLQFSISMKVLSILRYISDHLSVLPLSVMTRLLNTHDIPSMLVSVLENAPWNKSNGKGEPMRYEDGQWRLLDPADRLKLCKTEGQVWLTLYQLLLDRDCQQKYEFNSRNKATILKLRGYLTEPLLGQIPHLTELQRYLEHLSFMEPPPIKKDLILEQVPVIYEKLIKDSSSRWASTAKRHAKLLLEPSKEELQAKAKHWVDSANLDMMETLVAGPPKCALCGKEASKRCSRCRNEWYCGRECQVKHWKKHKQSCDLISANKSDT